MREHFPPSGPASRRQPGIGFILAALVFICTAASGISQTFDPGCPLPFAPIAQPHPIDNTCPRRGDVPDPPVASNDPAHALQNSAKNNFCATGPPALVTFTSFKKLQEKLDLTVPAAKNWDRDHLPADRTVFSDVYTTSSGDTLSEGSVVQFAAWLMKRRPGSNESCNCDEGTAEEAADIHIVLISKSDRETTPECSSVTAEISPHGRPKDWVAHIILLANDHPFRLTGQLFYDAAHRPCSGSPPKAASMAPSRISSWEIHPVYGIDVCKKKSLTACKANDDAAWTALDAWAANTQGDE